MKRILFSLVLMALLTGYSCSSEEDKSPKPPVCSLTAPQDGAILDLYQDMIIKGTASDSDGKIVRVALAIDGKTVPEITEVPFEHKILAKDLKEGSMKISLAVADDGSNVANDEITVTIQDQSEAPTCSITAPAHGSELNVYAPFKIEGGGIPYQVK